MYQLDSQILVATTENVQQNHIAELVEMAEVISEKKMGFALRFTTVTVVAFVLIALVEADKFALAQQQSYSQQTGFADAAGP